MSSYHLVISRTMKRKEARQRGELALGQEIGNGGKDRHDLMSLGRNRIVRQQKRGG